jgi:2-polyprenyl-3-methyl-5-hydroxy-6-metoxy-1,4-benzoquinol methylase
MDKTWGRFYRNVCGSRRLLEGSIMANAPFVAELARLVKAGDKVLEVGAGTGVLGWPLAEAGIGVTCLDNDEEVLRMCEINAKVLGADIKYVFGDAFDIPFEESSFNLAYSEGLLEHYSDEEIHRLLGEQLRVAGIVVVGVPLVGCKDIPFGNERWLSVAEWENLLERYLALRAFSYNNGTRLCVSLMGGQ